MRMNYNKHAQQKGFSLIEVLISLFILAVGVLGIIGMQTLSLKNGIKSVARTHAASLSYEIIDRIRANKTQDYVITTNRIPDYVDCFTAECSAAALVNFDIAEWKCNFLQYQNSATCTSFVAVASSTHQPSQLALNGDASVTCSLVGGEKHCFIRINWTEASTYTSAEEQFSYAVTVII